MTTTILQFRKPESPAPSVPEVAGPVLFQVGAVYHVASVCDHNCIWNFRVIHRTAKTVKLQELGKSVVKSFRVSVYRDVEQVRPHGTYSMCAILSADRKGEKRPVYD